MTLHELKIKSDCGWSRKGQFWIVPFCNVSKLASNAGLRCEIAGGSTFCCPHADQKHDSGLHGTQSRGKRAGP